MRTKCGVLAAVLAGFVWLPVGSAALERSFEPSGQSFSGSGALPGAEGAAIEARLPAAGGGAFDAPDSSLCAEGTRAIDQGHWADAVRIFSVVAGQHGEHADAALYWKAYAEDKLGQTKPAANACSELRNSYPKSRWIDDCGALEVELHVKSGAPVTIEPGQSDDVKLLALNAMMRQNEPLALAEIQAILNGDASERLKKEAQFILGHHYSDVTYPQIVRISHVEGDVRIQRGEPTGKPNNAAWEQAVADVPLETGFSLATGAGRAEIEFENASTIYLGENSVLTFNDLHETAGVPYTELGLLSGMVSLYFRPYVPWEKLVLHTATNDVVSRYPDRTYARIESFTNGVSITPLEGGTEQLAGVAKDALTPGRTWTWVQGQLVDAAGLPSSQEFSAWDKWTGDRVAQRNAAISTVLEASGLTTPIPGMAEMAGQGKFFDCAPYGTCWEPKDAAGEDETADRRENRQRSQQPRFELAAYHPLPQAGQAAQSGSALPTEISEREFDFPCSPLSIRYRLVKDPVTGKQRVVSGTFMTTQPYDWAVCHAGSWIRHRKHYVWVAGIKRHHVAPVRWVKIGHTVAFVPLHPFDVKGQHAINAKHEVFAVTGKNQVVVQPVKFDPGIPINYLNEPPKEYRNELMRPLTLAEAPRMEAHPFERGPGIRGTEVKTAGVPIHFDLKSQTFMVARQQIQGGQTKTVFAPMTNHSGSLQARGESFSGGSGFRGGSSGSSSGFRGGGSSGGGSRGGGSSSSSSGGGAHSGGGGGGSTASSSSSVSSSASSASSSGSSSAHH